MTTIKTIGYMLLSCASISLVQTANAQNFYKWVDAKGSTHYTTTPPPKNAKKKGQVATYGQYNPNAASQNTPPQTTTTTPQPTSTTSIPAPPVQYDHTGQVIEQRSPQ